MRPSSNPVDGVVLDVLLNKAREIHKALGTHVPVPEESESVTEAVLNALFLRGGYQREAQQLAFDFMTNSIGRNHPFVAALARFLLEEALTKGGAAHAARGGVIATRAVAGPTVLLLLRVRYLVQTPARSLLLAEEVRVFGYTGDASAPDWLPEAEALRLLAAAQPDANLPLEQKKAILAATLEAYPTLEPHLRPHVEARARDLAEAHTRIRKAVRLRAQEVTVDVQWPVDLLGVLVLESARGERENGRRGEGESVRVAGSVSVRGATGGRIPRAPPPGHAGAAVGPHQNLQPLPQPHRSR